MNVWHKFKCFLGFHNNELIGSYYITGTTFIPYTDFEDNHIYLYSAYRCNDCSSIHIVLVHDFKFFGTYEDYRYYNRLKDIRKRFMNKNDFVVYMIEKGYINE